MTIGGQWPAPIRGFKDDDRNSSARSHLVVHSFAIPRARTGFGCLACFTLAACGHVNPYPVSGLPATTTPTATESTVAPAPPPDYSGMTNLSLCLSGGGYRAMLFHLGALWRLNEMGLLPEIIQVESVSGGSIVAAQLVLNWQKLHLIENHNVSPWFKAVVADPIVRQARHTIDRRAIIAGVLIPGLSPSFLVATALDGGELFDGKRLQDLPGPPAPTLTLVATDMETGLPWVFKKDFIGSPGRGFLGNNVRIADAVAASAAFPPVLSPAAFDFSYTTQRLTGEKTGVVNILHVKLADGGLINNLGSDLCEGPGVGVVSDAANPVTDSKTGATWIGQYYRITNIIYDAKERRLRMDATDPYRHENLVYLPLHVVDDAEVARSLGWMRNLMVDISHFVGGDHPPPQDQMRIDRLASLIPDENAATDEGEYLRHYEKIAMYNKEGTRLRKVEVARVRALVNLGYIQASIMIAQHYIIGEEQLKNEHVRRHPKDFERSTFWQEHSDQLRDFMTRIPESVLTSKITLPCKAPVSDARRPGSKWYYTRHVSDPTEICGGNSGVGGL